MGGLRPGLREGVRPGRTLPLELLRTGAAQGGKDRGVIFACRAFRARGVGRWGDVTRREGIGRRGDDGKEGKARLLVALAVGFAVALLGVEEVEEPVAKGPRTRALRVDDPPRGVGWRGRFFGWDAGGQCEGLVFGARRLRSAS